MNAEFNWWLLIVGLVVGAGLIWLVLLDSRRREDEVDAAERAVEAGWISTILAEERVTVSPAVIERVLMLHADYLATTLPAEPRPDPSGAPDAPDAPDVESRATDPR